MTKENLNDEIKMQKESLNTGERVMESSQLFGDAKLVVIKHKNTSYRLMVTRQDKLILTK